MIDGERDDGERDSLIRVIFFASSLQKSHSAAPPLLIVGFLPGNSVGRASCLDGAVWCGYGCPSASMRLA